MTTGHRLFCKELLSFNTTPRRHTPLHVHFCAYAGVVVAIIRRGFETIISPTTVSDEPLITRLHTLHGYMPTCIHAQRTRTHVHAHTSMHACMQWGGGTCNKQHQLQHIHNTYNITQHACMQWGYKNTS